MIHEERFCPVCDDKPKLVFQDDSFSHEFGTEIIKFYYCEDCKYQEEE